MLTCQHVILWKLCFMHGPCNLAKNLLIFMIQQLMTSFKHLFNKQDINITSWGEVKKWSLQLWAMFTSNKLIMWPSKDGISP
jgi:hypothetical protein